jgi:hypothetical protein
VSGVDVERSRNNDRDDRVVGDLHCEKETEKMRVKKGKKNAVRAVRESSSLSRGGIPSEDDARNTLRGCY